MLTLGFERFPEADPGAVQPDLDRAQRDPQDFGNLLIARNCSGW